MPRWLSQGHNAVVTGGASGIGLAAAAHYLQAGMRVLIADVDEGALGQAAESLGEVAGDRLLTQRCDVTVLEQLESLQQTAADKLGNVHCLMNNAGASISRSEPWADAERWRAQLDINLWGIIYGCQAFMPAMIAAGEPAAVINTGSKQGITNPPGNYAYNLSKAGVKTYTESVAHALRQLEDCPVTAHLLIPGFTYTGMIARFVKEQPAGAWTPQQVVAFLVEALDRGDFYVLCPDNETPRVLDERRMQWNTDDLLRNRPALSRWHPDYADAYAAFVKDE